MTGCPELVIVWRMDHDQRLKTIIQTFFADFLRLFFADWAERFDLSRVEWRDKEVYPDPPEGSRHELDLIAWVPIAEAAEPGPEASIVLVHVEIESPDRTTRLKPRLPYYYHFLRDKYDLPVLPIVIYLKVGLDGVGVDYCVEQLWGLEVVRFQYLYVALPGLDGVEYVQGENWLGVALSALMRIPPERVAWLGAEALRRLAEARLSDQERFLLGECVQAYLPTLDDEQRRQYEDLIRSESYVEVQAMNQTIYEKGLEEGLVEGLIGQVHLCEGVLGRSPRPNSELRTLTVDELQGLLDALKTEALNRRPNGAGN